MNMRTTSVAALAAATLLVPVLTTVPAAAATVDSPAPASKALGAFSLDLRAGASTRAADMTVGDLNLKSGLVGRPIRGMIHVVNSGTVAIVDFAVGNVDELADLGIEIDLSGDDGLFLAGDERDFPVTWTPTAQGALDQDAVFTFAGGSQTTARLTGTASDHAGLTITGAEFGDVAVGSAETIEVSLTNTGSTVLKPSVTSTDDMGAVGLAAGEIEPMAPGASATVDLTWTPTSVTDGIAPLATLAVAYELPTGGTGQVTTPVRGHARLAQLTVTDIDFGDVPVTLQETRTVTVENTGNTILTPDVSNEKDLAEVGITLQYSMPTLAPGESTSITATWAPQPSAKKQRALPGIRVAFEDAAGAPAAAVAGVLGNPLEARAEAAGVDFGTILVGDTAQDSVTVTNRGNTTIAPTISNADELAEEGLTVLSDSIPALAPGQSFEVRLTWNPQAHREDSDTRLADMRFNYLDAADSDAMVVAPLRGATTLDPGDVTGPGTTPDTPEAVAPAPAAEAAGALAQTGLDATLAGGIAASATLAALAGALLLRRRRNV